MTPLDVLILLIWVVAAIFAASAIGNRKGRPGTGFLLAVIFVVLAHIPS